MNDISMRKDQKKETQIGYNWVNMEAVNEVIIF